MVTLARREEEKLSPLREESRLATFFRSLRTSKTGGPGRVERVFGRPLGEHLASSGENGGCSVSSSCSSFLLPSTEGAHDLLCPGGGERAGGRHLPPFWHNL